MSKTIGEPDTWYLTQSDIKNHVEYGKTGPGLLQVTNPDNEEDPGLVDRIDDSQVTSYLADPTSIKGIALRNKWKWNIIREYGHNGLAYDPQTKKMYPGVEEAIAKLPAKYQHFIKFDMGADLTAHAANAGKNAFADFAVQYGLPTMLTITGLGPLATSVGSIGFLPTIANTAASVAGGYAGAKGGEWVGKKLDSHYGTNYWTPTLSLVGGLGGGIAGGALTNKLMFNSVKNNFSIYDPTSRRSQFNSKVFGQEFLDDANNAAQLAHLRNVEASYARLNTPSPQRTDLTINAPGNAEGIPMIYGPTFAGPYKWQNMLALKQNVIPSRLSAMELQGIPKHNRFFNTHRHIVSELPESAFISKNPLSSIQYNILNKSQSKFVKDVTIGGYFARRSSLQPNPVPQHFDIQSGRLGDPNITVKIGNGQPITFTRQGHGAESDVYIDPTGKLFKFGTGRRLYDPLTRRHTDSELRDWNWKWRTTPNDYEFETTVFASPEELIADYNGKYLPDLNKYWFTEPQYLEGWTADGLGNHFPVLSQKFLPMSINDVNGGNWWESLTPDKISKIKQIRYWVPGDKSYRRTQMPFMQNNIILENDLPVPLDAHRGNYRFDENGILRGTDLHKNGGKIKMCPSEELNRILKDGGKFEVNSNNTAYIPFVLDNKMLQVDDNLGLQFHDVNDLIGIPKKKSKSKTHLTTNNSPELTVIMPEFSSNEELTTTPTESMQEAPINGNHVFKHQGMNLGHMDALLQEAAKYGIFFRVTSGVRTGAKTKQGKTSYHALGQAIDITPIQGETYADLKYKIKNSPGFVKWMQDRGYGIFDETTPEVMKRTGASGAHWHIGKDRVAIQGLQQIINS